MAVALNERDGIPFHKLLNHGGLDGGGADLDAAKAFKLVAVFPETGLFGKKIIGNGGNDGGAGDLMVGASLPEFGLGVARRKDNGSAGKEGGISKSDRVNVMEGQNDVKSFLVVELHPVGNTFGIGKQAG